MATLFRHRNRRTSQDKIKQAGLRAAGRSRVGGRGLLARTRNLDGSAAAETRIAAARRGTLLQHRLKQSDERHRLDIDRGTKDLTQRQELQPHRVQSAGLINRATEQNIDQSAELQPGRVASQGVSLRRSEQVIKNDAGLQPTRVALASDAVQGSGLRLRAAEKQEQAIADQKAETKRIQKTTIRGMAQQIADQIAQTGGDITETMTAMGVPPELYGEVKREAEMGLEQLDESAGGLIDKPGPWYRFGIDTQEEDAAEARRKNIRGSLRRAGTSGASIRNRQVAAQQSNPASLIAPRTETNSQSPQDAGALAQKAVKDADFILANRGSDASRRLIKAANDNAATNPEAQALLDELARRRAIK